MAEPILFSDDALAKEVARIGAEVAALRSANEQQAADQLAKTAKALADPSRELAVVTIERGDANPPVKVDYPTVDTSKDISRQTIGTREAAIAEREANIASREALVAKNEAKIAEALERVSMELHQAAIGSKIDSSSTRELAEVNKASSGTAKAQTSHASGEVAIRELWAKQKSNASFTYSFGGLEAFYGMLASYLGPPEMVGGSILKAMEIEHRQRSDSHAPFQRSGWTDGSTTSADEWEFVTDPKPGKKYYGPPVSAEMNAQQRTATRLEVFEQRMAERNAQLRQVHEAPMRIEELIGARMYTGPIYYKYNIVLRALSGGPIDQQNAAKLGIGQWVDDTAAVDGRRLELLNKYVTTLQATNSGVIRMGKLSRANVIFYRGLPGRGSLPPNFFEPDAEGVRAGVERGFMSTTFDRAVAQDYINKGSDSEQVGTMLEISTSMTNRAADLSWLTQIPNEKEFLCGPLCAIEVRELAVSTDSTGRSNLVVRANLNVNHMGLLENQRPVEVQELVSVDEVDAVQEQLANSGQGLTGGKPIELISGQPKASAMGLYHFMCVPDPFAEDSTTALEAELVAFVQRLKDQAVTATLLGSAGAAERKAVQAIHYGATTAEEEINYWRKVAWCKPAATPAEVVARIENETLGNLKYILYESTSEEWVDGPDGIRDFQRGKMKFEDFMRHPNVSSAELTRPHVAALRLYTTLAFKYINSPLRHQSEFYDKGKPHPLPRTVAYINEGVKKLRAAYATRVAAGVEQPKTTLWRGMKNVDMSDDFMGIADAEGHRKGGTELAPLSTSTSFAVGAKYSLSGKSLLFRLSIENHLQYGAEIKWLSAFPKEDEVLYPPLTFLQPTGRTQTVTFQSGHTFEVVEVKPTLP